MLASSVDQRLLQVVDLPLAESTEEEEDRRQQDRFIQAGIGPTDGNIPLSRPVDRQAQFHPRSLWQIDVLEACGLALLFLDQVQPCLGDGGK